MRQIHVFGLEVYICIQARSVLEVSQHWNTLAVYNCSVRLVEAIVLLRNLTVDL
jgi:hypothetical protein